MTPNKSIQDYVNSFFKGKIVRSGYAYKKKDGTVVVVPPKVITDRGKQGKGRKLFTLKRGALSKYGYKDVKTMTSAKRHSALKKAARSIKPLSLFRKLNAVALLNKNTNPKVSRIFKSDAAWVKKNYKI